MKLRGVRHRFRGTGWVLDGVDLRIEPGRPVVVTGGNGSGKSTLLRVVAGVLRPTGGTVGGRPGVTGYLPTPFPDSRLSTRRLTEHLDAVHGLRRGAALDVLDRLGFDADPDRPVADLSAGTRTKVGLAQAVAVREGLVVLDEPWTALDDEAAAALDVVLAEEPARTLVVADHSGRATTLPGALTYRLADGALTRSRPCRPGGTRIELSCRGPAAAVAAALPSAAVGCCEGERLVVTVDVPGADRWLAAALAAGCSVIDVTRLPERSA
ncbi:ABC transporter ATP-binding protein [Actinomycetospora corticicola]|uniref:ABC-type transport system involved in cytochrome c biogenesis ATPase subunit n=1 Tax=Actinomycetospora corticicola TaxID=663602 RepID=A0A7Y9J4J5_9PSEU|nr:ATP-binding cassette domain-containing protein [Actinomycetospora corticicola]NYD35152.1 ABC-type transport system involved in cytochrome c biogenesis ATPase subunit [Actinomycetospora corticicola]